MSVEHVKDPDNNGNVCWRESKTGRRQSQTEQLNLNQGSKLTTAEYAQLAIAIGKLCMTAPSHQQIDESEATGVVPQHIVEELDEAAIASGALTKEAIKVIEKLKGKTTAASVRALDSLVEATENMKDQCRAIEKALATRKFADGKSLSVIGIITMLADTAKVTEIAMELLEVAKMYVRG